MNFPIDSAAAWRGDELFSRDDWQYTLTDSDVRELDDALQHSLAADPEPGAEQTGRFQLPELGIHLQRVQHDLENGSGVHVLRGLPIDRWSQAEAERVFWGITSHLGTPVAQTVNGDRIFHVRDEGFAEGHPQARGPSSRKRLSFHSDRCDVIAFLCLRQAKAGGENDVVSAVTLYNEMLERRPDLVAVLMQPFYYQRHNVDPGNERPYYQQPVFSIYKGHFTTQLLRVLIQRAYAMPELPDMSNVQRAALDYLEAQSEDPARHAQFRQQPGDIVLINNHVILHRRAEFEDYEQPERKRHLLRVWLSVPNSRPLDPVFEASYGATAAGAIRGGMRVR